MKLRIRGSSLRLRLTQPEVLAVGRGERVAENTEFAPGERLVYALETGGEEVSAHFQRGEVTVRIPLGVAHEWSTSDRVGIEVDQTVRPGATLRILIEKDFACLTVRAGEDDTHAFPHPSK
jgi:hypothetical protein